MVRFVVFGLLVSWSIIIGKMEDYYVVLFEKVVVENVRFREAIEARDNE